MKNLRDFKVKSMAMLLSLGIVHSVYAEDYQLPAAVNNPVAIPVGADSVQKVAQSAMASESPTTNKPTTALPQVPLSGADLLPVD